jgi:hypothetical protein
MKTCSDVEANLGKIQVIIELWANVDWWGYSSINVETHPSVLYSLIKYV